MKRQTWSSQLTYILAVAGATIGFGCTWRFPYLVGENGGGAYVLIFCLAMIVIGIPMILVENVIGRRYQKNAVDAFGAGPWKIVGYMGLIGAFGIMSYYMVIGGWVLEYIYNILTSKLDLSSGEITKELSTQVYADSIDNSPFKVILMTFLFVFINYIILKKGAVKGIENAAKVLMPLLFLLMIIMVIRNLTLDDAMKGVEFYLIPDFTKINTKLFIDVLGQVFFALSLGFGVMITMSSYLDKKTNLVKISVITGVLNTFIAVLAGFMIFPSLFSFGLEPASGPSLVFKTLPLVFSKIFLGNIIAILFFLLLMLAALTTSLPIYEVIITVICEKSKMSRNSAIILTLGVIFVLGNIPSALSSNILSDVTIFGKSIFDAFDSISATIFFIMTSLFCAIYVGWVMRDEAKQELKFGFDGSNKIVEIWYFYVKFIIPFVILAVFVSSFYDNFLK